MKQVIVSGGFDDVRSVDMRFLHAASDLGDLTVVLWSDEMIRAITGEDSKFSCAERHYVVDAIRYVQTVITPEGEFDMDQLPDGLKADIWIDREIDSNDARRAFCAESGIDYQLVSDDDLSGFPAISPEIDPAKKNVVVTGCYDWFHSGHVRFFEEVSEYGNLFVVVGHDENVRYLKGEGHPMFPEDERRYVAQSIRFVTQALVSSGMGWMDAEREIAHINADVYAVNDDGDKPEKQQFCKDNGLEYLVLKRVPKEGLTQRSSTDLRGF